MWCCIVVDVTFPVTAESQCDAHEPTVRSDTIEPISDTFILVQYIRWCSNFIQMGSH